VILNDINIFSYYFNKVYKDFSIHYLFHLCFDLLLIWHQIKDHIIL
jgi:hypothetical protein